MWLSSSRTDLQVSLTDFQTPQPQTGGGSHV
jgi:hypothetical protein